MRPGHPRTDDADGGAGCDVEHDDVGRVELVEGVDPHAGDHLAAELLERRDHRRTDRGGAALGDRPPVGVRGGGERDPDRRGHRGGQVAQGVCGDPAEQRPGLLAGPRPSQHRCWQAGEGPEPGQRHRVGRDAHHRPEEVGGDLVELLGQRAEHPPPPPAVPAQGRCGAGDRPQADAASTAVEGVGELHVRPTPGQPVPGQIELA
jgi:hypothetical protein